MWIAFAMSARAKSPPEVGEARNASKTVGRRVLSAYYAAPRPQAASARALPPDSAKVRAVTQMQRR